MGRPRVHLEDALHARPRSCDVGKFTEAIPLLRDSLAAYDGMGLGSDHPELGRQVFERDSGDLLVLEGNMADTLSQQGRHAEAAEVLERVIEARERSPRFGPSHASTWATRVSLGTALANQGKFSEAVPLLRDSLAAYDGMGLGSEHPLLGIIPHHLGKALLGAGDAAAAVPMFQRRIAFYERKFGLHHYFIPDDLINLAEALRHLSRGFDERLSLLNRAVAIRELSIGKDKESADQARDLAFALEKCAECYEEAGRLAEAEERWAKCVAAYTKVRAGFGDLLIQLKIWFFLAFVSVSVSVVSNWDSFLTHCSVFCKIYSPHAPFAFIAFICQVLGSADEDSQLASLRLEAVRRKLSVSAHTSHPA